MPALVLDEQAEEQILAQRRAAGHDRFDEVWDGVYVLAPLANNEQHSVATELSTILTLVCRWELGGQAFGGCNVSDQETDWRQNYRCPDVAVFFKENPAQDRGPYWYGGPDFAVEVASAKDRTWQKLQFYAAVKTRELLVIDRDPWKLSLLRLSGSEMVIVGASTITEGAELASTVVPLAFRLIQKPAQKPAIEVKHHDGRTWLVQPV